MFRKIRQGGEKGFTLIELMVVVAIVGILVTLAEPSYRIATTKAKEAALKRDLYVLRDTIDQYHADQGRYPAALADLVDKGYLRAIPNDPFTNASNTWVEIYVSEGEESGIYDVHSGSDVIGTNGTTYNEW
ncbi:MAG: prepilin-type N-terminal cleavage/methylation domain-containing protein [Candidatus Manganitrophaceae bacterium]|nr:MAG: prepilin-type N-terminal cleavage/methylation domain-containing protein [Candidatus Manganitrophaceae bacterium]